MEFSIADYVVFSLSMVISALVGFYYACTGGKQRSTGEFLFGDKKLSAFPIAMSLLASFTSATGILGATSEVYRYGIYPILECIAAIISILMTTYFFIPLIYNLHIPSIYMYLDLRFNKWLQKFVSLLFLINTFFYMSLCLYGPASALSQVTGLSLWASIIGSGLVCNLYTIIGGIKAVVLTDTIQQCLVFAGLLAVMIQGFVSAGGVSNVWKIGVKGKRIDIFSFSTDMTYLYTFWSITIGHILRILSGYTANQSMVQRFISVDSAKTAQRATLISIPLYVVNKTIYVLCGLVIYAKYYDCDPKITKKISKYEQILPLFVMETLGAAPGIPGLFVAAIYSASLSAMSTGLNSMAAVILNDLIKPWLEVYNKKRHQSTRLSDRKETSICKLVVAIFGVIVIGSAFIVPHLGETLYQTALSLMGLVSGSILAIFIIGMFVPFSNSYGAALGSLLGTLLPITMFVGSLFYGRAIPPPSIVRTDGCLWNNETLQIMNFSTTMMTQSTTMMTQSTTMMTQSTTMMTQSTKMNVTNTGMDFFRVSPLYYNFLGFLTTIVIGSLVSIFTGGLRQKIKQPNLIHPVFEKRFLCLPHFEKRALVKDLSTNEIPNSDAHEMDKLNPENEL